MADTLNFRAISALLIIFDHFGQKGQILKQNIQKVQKCYLM